MFDLDECLSSPKRLTQVVLQITQLLGLYQAELARLLGMQCKQIGELSSARQLLSVDSPAWHQAELFVRLYNALELIHQGDEIAMYHWLRRHSTDFKDTPLLMIVDHAELKQTVAVLEHRLREKQNAQEL